MLNIFWSTSLNQALTSLKTKYETPRIAIVGIGQELCGDDAVGIMIIRALKNRMSDRSHLLLVEGGSAPENHTHLLRRFKPHLVLLIDAADLNEYPGTIHWLSWEATIGLNWSTHTMSLYRLATYIVAEFGCHVALVGIQPLQLTMGKSMSLAVRKAVDKVSEVLIAALCSYY